MSSSRTGLLIALEGGEGSGKTTQAEILRDHLLEENIPTVLVHEPGTTSLGQHLRSYLKSKQPITKEAELLLFESSRAQLVTQEIRPALGAGYTVISDRFSASSTAYQGHGRGIPLQQVGALNEFATGGLEPDLNILLDIEPGTGLRRATPQMSLPTGGQEEPGGRQEEEGQRRFEDQPQGFHRRVREGYLKTGPRAPRTVAGPRRRPAPGADSPAGLDSRDREDSPRRRAVSRSVHRTKRLIRSPEKTTPPQRSQGKIE